MSEPNWADYDGFIKDAEKDDRVGDHQAMVASIEAKTWPSGDPFTKVVIELLTANRAKADFNLQPLPTPGQIKTESGTWTTGKKKAIAQAVQIQRNLALHYKLSPATLKVGDEFSVKIVKTKDGYCRVAAILPPGGPAAAKSSSDVPF